MSESVVPSRPVQVLRALAVLCEPPTEAHVRLADALDLGGVPTPADYTEVFVLGVSPYASVHLGPEGMIGGEARDRIAGFWGAVGHTPPAEPDHLSALLGLYASLAEGAWDVVPGAASAADASADQVADGSADPAVGARAVLMSRARDALLHEHLAPWLPMFLERIEALGGFYAGWAALLAQTVAGELAVAAPPAGLPLHLREAPPLPDPRVEGAPAFLSGLLAPVRAGMIVTRFDLVRLARGLQLGARIGERRWVLEHLLGLEPEPVLAGLAELARAAAVAHAERSARASAASRDLADWWRARAEAAAALIDDLALVESSISETRTIGAASTQ